MIESDPDTATAFLLYARHGWDPAIYWNKPEGHKVVLRAFVSRESRYREKGVIP